MKNKSWFSLLMPFFIALSLVIVGCESKTDSVSEVLLTDKEKEEQKNQVKALIKIYNDGANERNWQKMVTTLADEITFFGTDSGESSKNFNEFKNTMQRQWEEYEVLTYSDLDTNDCFVTIDDYARYGNVIYRSYIIYGSKDNLDTLHTVTQRTLKKDINQNKWVIESGILAITRNPE